MHSLYPCLPLAMPHSPLIFRQLVEVTEQPERTKSVIESISSRRATISTVPRVRISTADDFEKILRAGKPVVLEGCGLGTCIQKWNSAYITANVGPQRRVSISTGIICHLRLTNELGRSLSMKLLARPWISIPETSVILLKTSHPSWRKSRKAGGNIYGRCLKSIRLISRPMSRLISPA